MQARYFLSQANGMLPADPSCPSCGPGYLFYATPDQRANTGMYATQVVSDPNKTSRVLIMNELQDAMEVWDNGVASPFNPPTENIVAWLDDFFLRTGARRRIATRWTYQGRTYESKNCPVPIPDYSGLVYPTKDWKQWIVLNPDGTIRFTIEVPKISPQSSPENGEIGEPKHMKGQPLHIMYGEGSDGHRDDCRFFFNMNSGQLENVELVGRHW